MKTPLRFGLSAININQAWQIVPLYKEIVKRGHSADVFASLTNTSSYIPFNIENIPWEPLETADREALMAAPYDVIIESDELLSTHALAAKGFTLGFFPGGCGHWLTTGDNLPALCRHNVWVMHHQFEVESRRLQGFDGIFPISGMPSLSNYTDYSPKKKERGTPLKGLYLNGPPFEKTLKDQFTRFLARFAETNSNVNLLIKERFLSRDMANHYELEVLKIEKMQNVHVLDGYASAVELIKEADFLLGISTTAFIEALFIKKPVFIIEDYDTEYLLGVRTGIIYPQCLGGFTRVAKEHFITNFSACLEARKTLTDDEYKKNFPHPDPCHIIIDIAETIKECQKDRPLSGILVEVPYHSREQYHDAVTLFMNKLDSSRQELVKRREEFLFLTTVFSELLRIIRCTLPRIPSSYYTRFITDLKKEFEAGKEDEAWQVSLFENIGTIFFNYLDAVGGIKEEWLPPEGSLFDKSSDKYLQDAMERSPLIRAHIQKLIKK
ncbi:hypothetical protein [Estrella lausannensis]|uniref:Uncharacterized protein n=1 Tax=Estrella lausannensis TaxID=483423 RepID=A0A0H5DRD7_9BACT|nr:hypothetical protein [Estrella lausannensis]CRX39256.1 Hypothetical protein ELAC_1932 [Estrella lausannensis]